MARVEGDGEVRATREVAPGRGLVPRTLWIDGVKLRETGVASRGFCYPIRVAPASSGPRQRPCRYNIKVCRATLILCPTGNPSSLCNAMPYKQVPSCATFLLTFIEVYRTALGRHVPLFRKTPVRQRSSKASHTTYHGLADA